MATVIDKHELPLSPYLSYERLMDAAAFSVLEYCVQMFYLGLRGDMKPRISVITLAVSDLNQSLAFYRDGMGLPTQGIVGTEFEDGAVVFFHVNESLILALYPKNALAKDAHVSVGSASAAEFSIGHNVGSKQEADTVMQQAKQAGAKITDPAHDRFWGGYSGYFQDPDGHLWEVAWDPQGQVPE